MPERPEGLLYRPGLISSGEESRLLSEFAELEFDQVVMHGQAARRTVRHYGFGYGFESWQLTRAEPIPDNLSPLLHRCASVAGVEPEEFEQALVTRYPPGASIGWHRDAAAFGPVVLGVSLGSECVMRFQRRAAGDVRLVYEQRLAPRSCYVLTGAARSAWQHSIPPVPHERYSVTFRMVRRSRRP